MSLLSNDEVKGKLENLTGWSHSDKSIEKEFELKDFTHAIGFVTQVGIEAEKADHHPDILIHSWNKVKIKLSSHDEGGVTEKDISLAEKVESF